MSRVRRYMRAAMATHKVSSVDEIDSGLPTAGMYHIEGHSASHSPYHSMYDVHCIHFSLVRMYCSS